MGLLSPLIGDGRPLLSVISGALLFAGGFAMFLAACLLVGLALQHPRRPPEAAAQAAPRADAGLDRSPFG